ncbi:histidine kinase/DNA gyrase B/HSP90-like ATPase [Lysobacter ruishenii]|uniref:Histidine kinase/DNA gyrase B/HSP90-like ATPase n=2 Tax=Aerolutibacter ruishenii TaxID=686800 RepID=A0A562LWR8_9GAMM|nr:histidine kinase/DNA gyrase B/HSP90-like ATPase [Lysobacter ruishenii]
MAQLASEAHEGSPPVVEHGPPIGRRGMIILAAWALVAMLFAGQAWFAAQVRGEPLAWTRVSAIWFVWAAVWAALTPIALRLEARYPLQRPRLLGSLAVHGVASAACALVNLALFALAAPVIGATQVEPTWLGTFSRLLGTTLLLNLPVYWLIVAAAHGERLVRAAREKDRRQLRLEAQLADARLQTLRTQLQPHFLFNALNTIAVLMREDVDSAERILLQLSALLRRSLDSSEAHEVTLGDEIAFLESYLEIEQARFAGRLSYRIFVPDHVLEARVPNLILQPLVENALRHGLATRAGPGHVEIKAQRQGDSLLLRVADDGRGLPPATTERVGLANTRARLRLLYADRQRFDVRNSDDGGVVAEIELPWRTAP